MMLFRVQSAAVPGTRNAGNRHQHKDVPGVPGVPAFAPVRARNGRVFFTHAHLFSSPCVHRRNTRNTQNNNVTMRVSAVPGTRNVKKQPGTQLMAKPLSQTMPETAAFIDALREAFGAEMINEAIKAGIDGQPTFWAKENGQEIGTRAAYSPERTVSMADTRLGPWNAPTASQNANRRK